MSKETVTSSSIEKAINDLMTRYILAVIDDIKADWAGPDKFAESTYQSYKNFCQPKAGKKENLAAIFTIRTETKQIYAGLYSYLITEFRAVEPKGESTMDSIMAEICENEESYVDFMQKVAAEYKPKFGPVLSSAADVEQYFLQRMTSQLTQYKAVPVLTASISTMFNEFLKATAWIIARQFWYMEMSINQGYFLGMLSLLNMKQIMIDQLQSIIRKPKPKAAAKTAATTAVVTATATAPTEQTPATATAPTDQPVASTEQTPAPASTQEISPDLLANL